MSWIEVTIEVERDDAERWGDALLEAGALAVTASDADADAPDEQPLFAEPGLEPEVSAWRHTRLAVLLAADASADAIFGEAAEALGATVPPMLASREVPDDDWVRATQAQFEPIEIGTRLLVVPSWHVDHPVGDRVRLVLDPGLAFGTGSHPTTRLCLEWLDAHLAEGETVIDYGCGSGILAIAAARLGASRVSAVDIDPQALLSTRDNAIANGVQLADGQPGTPPAGDAAAPPPISCPAVLDVRDTNAPKPEPAQVVVANILSSPLKLLAPMLAGLVAPGGALVLSGVLARQAEEVAAAYAPYLPVTVAAERDGWVALAGRRPATPA